MVLGYHICFGAYGFWLPNDPRGSGSTSVWAEHLRMFGPATGLDDRARSVAGNPHDRALRAAAKRELKYPAVQFTGEQARVIGEGFRKYIVKNGVIVWACSILPTHVHLVVARHRYDAETMTEQFKGAATRELIEAGIHPLAACKIRDRPPCCWQRNAWFPFLSTPEEIQMRIRYVEDNPEKEGKRRQTWSFIVRYLP